MKLHEAIKEYQQIQDSYNQATQAASCKESQHMNWFNTYIKLRDLRNEINDTTRKSAGKTELLEAIDEMKLHIKELVANYLGVDIRHEIFKRENYKQHRANFKARAEEEREEISKIINDNLSTWKHLKPTREDLESGKLDSAIISLIKGLDVSLSIDKDGDYFFSEDGQHIHLNNMIINPHFLQEIKGFLVKLCVEPITANALEDAAENAYYEYWQYDTDYWTERN